ncbi:MAG: hypothetical protein QM765_34630 [Myxococcales bacterium]
MTHANTALAVAVAVVAVVLLLVLAGCTSKVPRVEGTQLWIYDAKGTPAPGLDLAVEVADAPDEGQAAKGWKEAARVKTDAQGRAQLPASAALRLAVPLPHGSGARGFVNRVQVGGVAIPTEQSLVAHVVVDERGRALARLAIGSDALPFEARDATSRACCALVRRVGLSQPFLAHVDPTALGRTVREALLSAGAKEGLQLVPEVSLPSDLEAKFATLLGLTLQGEYSSKPGVPPCRLDARLYDAAGSVPAGFRGAAPAGPNP